MMGCGSNCVFMKEPEWRRSFATSAFSDWTMGMGKTINRGNSLHAAFFSLRLPDRVMSDETAAVATTPAAATPKKKAKSAAKKPKTAPTHPKVADMVNEAITNLKERGGSSLQAIKKHIGTKHKVDMDRLTPFIRKYLKSAVVSGALIQTKGKGASGSFKLSAGQKTKEPGKAKKAKKEGSPAKKPKSAAKKTAKPKAKSAEKKKPAAKKPAAKKAAKPKTPKKASKPSKPKAPKVKKMKTPKKATPKKASKK
jgi:histone H1/5